MRKHAPAIWLLLTHAALLLAWSLVVPGMIARQLIIVEDEQASAVHRSGILEDRQERRDKAQDEFNKTMIDLLEQVVKEVKEIKNGPQRHD